MQGVRLGHVRPRLQGCLRHLRRGHPPTARVEKVLPEAVRAAVGRDYQVVCIVRTLQLEKVRGQDFRLQRRKLQAGPTAKTLPASRRRQTTVAGKALPLRQLHQDGNRHHEVPGLRKSVRMQQVHHVLCRQLLQLWVCKRMQV